jgi:ABC-type uncharacterized transport system ATPase subunit
MTILDTDRLDKSYGLVHAVDNLSLKVEQGRYMEFLAQMGVGKQLPCQW